MIVLRVDVNLPDPDAIRAASDAIRRGDLVVFPTETVYGLAANALDEDAVLRVFAAKGRAEGHPLPIQVAGADQLVQVASRIPEGVMALAARFWPGPLTLVLPKSDRVPDIVTGGAENVGVRVPDHPVALALLREVGLPIVATSANISGHEPPRSAGQVARQLVSRVAVVLDAGECRLGVPSTVIDVSVSRPVVLRLGAIGVDEIEAVVGRVDTSSCDGEK